MRRPTTPYLPYGLIAFRMRHASLYCYKKTLRTFRRDGFRLLPFRSPLLGECIFVSFPPVTEMFHFTGLSQV